MTARTGDALLRGPEAPQRPTYLELFFDLAFVFALSQLSREVSQHLSWSGAFQTLVLMLALFRVWISTTWITDRLDPLAPAVQLLVSVSVLGTLILAVSLPQAFGKRGLVFAGVYVTGTVGRSLYMVIAMRGHELQRIAVRALLWSGVSALLWIAGGSTHGTTRGVLWILAVAVENAGYLLNFPVPGARYTHLWEPPIAAEHLAERYRQFFIIALGELIIVSGETFTGGGLALGRTTGFVVSIATTALMLRIYIYHAGQLLSEAPAAVPMSVHLARWTAYSHLVMVAGIIVTAVGDELVITHPSGRTPLAWGLVILGGPALFLVGRVAFNYAVFAPVSLDRPIGVLALAALIPIALLVSPLQTAIAATAILAVVVIADVAGARRHPAQPPSPRSARSGRGGG
jgi:low temperature requirement protein LtrA